MTEEVKDNNQPAPQRKLFAEGRGKYSLVDNQKVFVFDFPLNTSLEENLASISYIKDEIFRAISDKNEREKKAAEEKKEEKCDSKKGQEKA